jgi:hypothetical protein
MNQVDVKFGKEGKMTLLSGGERSGSFGNGSDQWLMVCEKSERTTF